MKAIGYVRVSTQGQAEEGISLDAQESKIRAWAEMNDTTEVLIFRDEGISGKRSDNRPGLQAALDAVEAGDAFIVFSLSRLSRSLLDTITLSNLLQKRGVDLVSITDRIDTTSASGKLYFNIMAAFNQHYRDSISEHTRGALQYMKAKGMKTGGDVPFGYTAKCGQLFEDPKEQATVREISTRRKRGESLRTICRALESKGIPRKNGGQTWTPCIVSDILKRIGSHQAIQRQLSA